MTEILYNNNNPFGDITPLVTRTREQVFSPGGIMHNVDRFVLEGNIIRSSCEESLESLYNRCREIVNYFSENFKSFKIKEGASIYYETVCAIIDSISFDSNRFFNIVPFKVSLHCYSGSYADIGVLDPIDSYSYDSSDGCLIKITHTVSARAINTSSDAISNLKNFIFSRKTYNPSFLPIGYTVNNQFLVEEKESFDPVSCSASITLTYIFDRSEIASGAGYTNMFIKYSSEISKDSGFYKLIVKGYVRGRNGISISELRNSANLIKNTSDTEASYNYSIYNPSGTIRCLGFNCEENLDENKIDFTVEYSDSYMSDPFVIDSTTLEIGPKKCISTNLTIKSLFGCVDERKRKNNNYMSTLNIEDYLLDKWETYGDGSSMPVGNVTQGIEVDNLTGDITINASICSEFADNCGCLKNLTYQISGEEPLSQYSETASLKGEGCYYIQDLGYTNRAKFAISGSCMINKCCEISTARNELFVFCNYVMTKHFTASDIILDGFNVSNLINGGLISFSASWNGEKKSLL